MVQARRSRLIFLLICAGFCSAAEVTFMRPTCGPAGTEITLTGTGFDQMTGFTFHDREVPLLEHSGTRIRFRVPVDSPPGDWSLVLRCVDSSITRTFQVDDRPRARIVASDANDSFPAVRLTVAGFGAGLSVTFNGRPAKAVVAGPNIIVLPPPDAAEGIITVADATGDGASFQCREPAAPPAAETKTPMDPDGWAWRGSPVISSFKPKSGDGDQTIVVKGSHLDDVTEARIGTTRLRFWLNGEDSFIPGDQLTLAFPPGALPVSGPITLLSKEGVTTSAGSFTVAPHKPEATFTPAQAGIGAWVAFSGTFLDRVTAVSFGGTASTDFQGRTPTRFRVAVPAGAHSGPVTLATVAGENVAVGGFTVGEGAPLAYGIGKAYITQGIQDGRVPLVAGRPGVLRAFVLANQANTVRPRLRVRLFNPAGEAVLDETLGPPAGGIPADLDEDELGNYNARVPGDLIQPGLLLRTELLPDPAQPPGTTVLPAPPDQPLEVKDGPVLALRIVPLVYRDPDGHERTGNVDQDMGAWRDGIMARFPVRAVDFAVLPPLQTGMQLKEGSVAEMAKLRDILETARLATAGAGRQNWHGLFSLISGSSVRGIATAAWGPGQPERRTSIGLDRPEPGIEVMCHEVAHTKGREHAPCGTRTGIDPAFPDPPAGLGGAAFDVAAQRPLASWAYFDMMGYCEPRWVSAYTYRGLLDFLLADRAPAAAGPAPAPRDCLEVSGRVQGDAVSLDPALEFKGRPGRPEPGDCTLACLDAQGRALLKVPFVPQEVEDGGPVKSFVLLVPMTCAMKARLASLRVTSGHGRPAVETRAARARRAPVATAWGAGRVALTWDAAAWPLVLVRDPRSGAVLADAGGGLVELRTKARELELLLSDRVRTTVRRVAVRP